MFIYFIYKYVSYLKLIARIKLLDLPYYLFFGKRITKYRGYVNTSTYTLCYVIKQA